jgi:hypothetical protein
MAPLLTPAAVIAALMIAATVMGVELCSDDFSRCTGPIRSDSTVCPTGWLLVSEGWNTSRVTSLQCASRRFEPYPPQDIEYFCSSIVMSFGDPKTPPNVVVDYTHGLTGSSNATMISAIQRVSEADPGENPDPIALSGAFIGPTRIRWFDPRTELPLTEVSNQTVDANSWQFLQSPTAADLAAAGLSIGCVGYHPSNGSFAVIPCGYRNRGTAPATFSFICMTAVKLMPRATPAPTPAPNTTAPNTTSAPNTTVAPSTPAPIFTQPSTPCAEPFTFSFTLGLCIGVIAPAAAGRDSSSTCSAAFYFAYPMTLNTTVTAQAASSLMIGIGLMSTSAGGATVHRSVPVAWTGGVYSVNVGSGAWMDPSSTGWDDLNAAGLWDASEPSRMFGCLGLTASSQKLRLMDCDAYLPTLCAYVNDGRTIPPKTTVAPPTVPPSMTTPAPSTAPRFQPACMPGWALSPVYPDLTPRDAERNAAAVAKCVYTVPDVTVTMTTIDSVCADMFSRQLLTLRRSILTNPDDLKKYIKTLNVDINTDVFGLSLKNKAEQDFVVNYMASAARNATMPPASYRAMLGVAIVNNGHGYWFDSRTNWVDSLPAWSNTIPPDALLCATIDATGAWRAVACSRGATDVTGVGCEYFLYQGQDEIPTAAPPPAPTQPLGSRLQTLDGQTTLTVALNTLGAHKVATVGGNLNGQNLYFSVDGTCPSDAASVTRVLRDRPQDLIAISADGFVYPMYTRPTTNGVVCTVVPALSPPIDSPTFVKSGVNFTVLPTSVDAAQLAALRINPDDATASVSLASALAPDAAPATQIRLKTGITAELRLFGPSQGIQRVRFADTRKCNYPAFVFGAMSLPVANVTAARYGGATSVASLQVAETLTTTSALGTTVGDIEDVPLAARINALPSLYRLCVSVDGGNVYTMTSVTATVPAASVSISFFGYHDEMRGAGFTNATNNYNTSLFDSNVVIAPEHSSPMLELRGEGLTEGMLLRLSSDASCASEIHRTLLLSATNVAFPETLDWDVPITVQQVPVTPAPGTNASVNGPMNYTTIFLVQLTEAHTRTRTTDGRLRPLDSPLFTLAASEYVASVVARFTVCVATSPFAPFFSTGRTLNIRETTITGFGEGHGIFTVGQSFSGSLIVHGMTDSFIAPGTMDRVRLQFRETCDTTATAAVAKAYGPPLPLVIHDRPFSTPMMIVPQTYLTRPTLLPLKVCWSTDAGVSWMPTRATMHVQQFLLIGLGRKMIMPLYSPDAVNNTNSTIPAVITKETATSIVVTAGVTRIVAMSGIGLAPHIIGMIVRGSCRYSAVFNPSRDVVLNVSVSPVGLTVWDDTAATSRGTGTQFGLVFDAMSTQNMANGSEYNLCMMCLNTYAVFPTAFSIKFVTKGVDNITYPGANYTNGAISYALTGALHLNGIALDGASVVAALNVRLCNDSASWLWPAPLPVQRTPARPDDLSGRGTWAIRITEAESATLTAAAAARIPATTRTDEVWCIKHDGSNTFTVIPNIPYRVLAMSFTSFRLRIDAMGASSTVNRYTETTRANVPRGATGSLEIVGSGGVSVKDALIFFYPYGASNGNVNSCDAAAMLVDPGALLPVNRGMIILTASITRAMAPGRYRLCFTASSRLEVLNAAGTGVRGGFFASAGGLTVDFVTPSPAIVAVYPTTTTTDFGRPLRSTRVYQGDSLMLKLIGEDLSQYHAVRLSAYFPPRCDLTFFDPFPASANLGNSYAVSNLSGSPRDMALMRAPTPLSSASEVWLLRIGAEQTSVPEGAYSLCVRSMNGWLDTHAIRIDIEKRYVSALSVRQTDRTAGIPFRVDIAGGFLQVVKGRPSLQLNIEVEGPLAAYSTAAFVLLTVPLTPDGLCDPSASVFAPITRPSDDTDPYVVVPPNVGEWEGEYRVCVDINLPKIHVPVAAEVAYPPNAVLFGLQRSASRFSKVRVAPPTIVTLATPQQIVPQRESVTVQITGWGLQNGMTVAMIPAIDSLQCADIGTRVSPRFDILQTQPRIPTDFLILSTVRPSNTVEGFESSAGTFTLLPEQTDATMFNKLIQLRSDPLGGGEARMPDGSFLMKVCFTYDRRNYYDGAGGALVRVAALSLPPPLPRIVSIEARQADGTWTNFTYEQAGDVAVAVRASLFGFTWPTSPGDNATRPAIIRLRGSRINEGQKYYGVTRPANLRATDSACAYGSAGATNTIPFTMFAVSREGDEAQLGLEQNNVGFVSVLAEYELCVSEANLALRSPLSYISDVATAGVLHALIHFDPAVGPTVEQPVIITSINGAADAAMTAGDAGIMPVRLSAALDLDLVANSVWIRLVDQNDICAAVQSHERRYRVNITNVTPSDQFHRLVAIDGTIVVSRVDLMVASNAPRSVCIAVSPRTLDPELEDYQPSAVTIVLASIRTLDRQPTLTGVSIVEGNFIEVTVQGTGLSVNARVRVTVSPPTDDNSVSQEVCDSNTGPFTETALTPTSRLRFELPMAQTDTQSVAPSLIQYQLCLTTGTAGRWIVQEPVVLARPTRVTLLHTAGLAGSKSSVRYEPDGSRVVAIAPNFDGWLTAIGEGLSDNTWIVFGCTNDTTLPTLTQPLSRNWDLTGPTPSIPDPIHSVRVQLTPDLLARFVGLPFQRRLPVCLKMYDSLSPSIRQNNIFIALDDGMVSDASADPLNLGATLVTLASGGLSAPLDWDYGLDPLQQHCMLANFTAPLPAEGVASLRFGGVKAEPAAAVRIVEGNQTWVPICSRSIAPLSMRSNTNVSAIQFGSSLGYWQPPVNLTNATVVAPYVSNVSEVPLPPKAWRLSTLPDVTLIAVDAGTALPLDVTFVSPFERVLIRLASGAVTNACRNFPADSSAPSEVVNARTVISSVFTANASKHFSVWPPHQPTVPAQAMVEATYTVCATTDGGRTYFEVPKVRIAIVNRTSAAALAEAKLPPRSIRVPLRSHGMLRLTGYVGHPLLSKGTLSQTYQHLMLAEGELWFPEGSLVMLSPTCLYSSAKIGTSIVGGGGVALLATTHTVQPVTEVKVCVRRRVVDTPAPAWSHVFLLGFATSGFVDTGLTYSVMNTNVTRVNSPLAPAKHVSTTVMPYTFNDVPGAALWPLMPDRARAAEINDLLLSASVRVGRPCDDPLPGPLGRATYFTSLGGLDGSVLMTLSKDQSSFDALEQSGVKPGEAMSLCVSVGEDADMDGVLDASPFFLATEYQIVPAHRAVYPLHYTGVVDQPNWHAIRQGRSAIVMTQTPVSNATDDATAQFVSAVAWEGFVSEPGRVGNQTIEEPMRQAFMRNHELLVPPRDFLLDLWPIHLKKNVNGDSGLYLAVTQPISRWVIGMDNILADQVTVLATHTGVSMHIAAFPTFVMGDYLRLTTKGPGNQIVVMDLPISQTIYGATRNQTYVTLPVVSSASWASFRALPGSTRTVPLS